MLKIIAAHFRKVGRAFAQCFNEIATGIETDNPDLKQTGLWGLWGLLLPRLILWGIPGIYFAIRGVLGGYLELIMIVYAVGMVFALGTKDRPQVSNPPQPQPEPDVSAARARAEEKYDSMKLTAFILFVDLCRYLPGLVAPTSPTAVIASVDIEITPKLTAKFPFVIGKGKCISTHSEIQETLDQILAQHLKANDLPIAIDDYPASDGEMWPGLVVDAVYDMGNQYRVDLVITDEAEAAVLKKRKKPGFGNNTAATPQDPDFD